MSDSITKELLDVLREAYWHLVMHDQEYHHITPKELLEKIRKLISEEKPKETQ